MINEKYIESYLESLEEKGPNNVFLEQEELLEYLQSNTFSSLNEHERKTLFFCFEVIFNSYLLSEKEEPQFDLEAFLDAEEDNWAVREDINSWPKTVDAFFEDYKEEDLLAFIEDTLVEDEEGESTISDIAREIIFISAKSFIDSLDA